MSKVPPVSLPTCSATVISDAGSVTSIGKHSIPTACNAAIDSTFRAVAKTRYPRLCHSCAKLWPIPPTEHPVIKTDLRDMVSRTSWLVVTEPETGVSYMEERMCQCLWLEKRIRGT